MNGTVLDELIEEYQDRHAQTTQAASAIMTAGFVAPKYKLFCRCIVCGLCFLSAIYFAITLASTAATIGLIISSVMAVMNVIYLE